jgi:hypothetical protein
VRAKVDGELRRKDSDSMFVVNQVGLSEAINVVNLVGLSEAINVVDLVGLMRISNWVVRFKRVQCFV